jgi:starch synthase
VALGSGDAGLVAGMRAIATARPGSVAMVERFDRDLARRIYAGADLFLMPSRFEPCGQGQMIAMRYGTPPIARRTGGLADTIVDLHEEPDTGTGFLFDDATPDALRFACERAIAVLRDPNQTRWDGLVRRGMAVDWDWERGSAPAYAAMFRRAVAARQAARASFPAPSRAAGVSPAATMGSPATPPVSPAAPRLPRPRRP